MPTTSSKSLPHHLEISPEKAWVSLSSVVQRLFFFICWHHLFMLSHMTYSGVLAGADTQGMLCGHRTLMLRKATSLCYSSIAADAAVWRKGGEKTPTEDLQNWFVLFFSHCKRSMRHKSERKMAFTAMKVYKHPPTASASLHISWHYKV